jgi:hypothetical protein
VLGIFGKNGVYNADWWDDCGAGSRSYISPAFRLYTNYDGLGAHFGNTGVAATASDATNASVYGAIQGSSDAQLTLVVLNKSSLPVQGTFALNGGTAYASARAWGFDQNSPALVARTAPILNAGGTSFSYTLPALSATTIELQAATPLPVTLTEFTGQAQADGSNLLRWRTATEVNTAAFEVQRSANGHDFRTLLRVPAAGSSGPRSYSAHDTTPDIETGEATTYYRLRMLDEDGSVAFSPVLALAQKAGISPLTLAAFPNPVLAGLALKLVVQNPGSAQSAQLRLTDALGRVALNRTVTLPSGANTLNLTEAASWPRGLYLLTLSSNTGSVARLKVSLE